MSEKFLKLYVKVSMFVQFSGEGSLTPIKFSEGSVDTQK